MQIIVFLLIFIFQFLTTPKLLLFYDQIEYINLVSTHSFWQVFYLGHFPIHPFFQAIFWITSRLTIPNYTAFFFGIASALVLYKICKIIFKDGLSWLALVLFLIFPGVWLINTNLMIQSIMLPFYLLSIYFFILKKPIPFLISNIILMGIHIDGVYWIASILLLPFLLKEELKMKKTDIAKSAKTIFLSYIIMGAFYSFIYLFIRKNPGGSMEQIGAYLSFGFPRIIRNIWVCLINNFGSFTIPLLFLVLLKKIKSKSEWIAWAVLGLLISIGGAYWEGDLMMRRIVFAGVIFALVFYKHLGKKIIFLILLLLPITAFNAALYYKENSSPLTLMQNEINKLPKDEVLVSSHYYYPFINYEGTILWFETGSVEKIDDYLKEGKSKRVFMTKESVTAPYLLVVGNNYHITSLNRAGSSEAMNLFKKYKIDSYGDSFEVKSWGGDISQQAGDPVIFYGQKFSERLSRKRINYGDIGIWIWSYIAGHKDAVGWTYKDASGAWVWPEISIK